MLVASNGPITIDVGDEQLPAPRGHRPRISLLFRAAFTQGGVDGLLGMHILARFAFQIDQNNLQLLFRPR